MKKIINPQNQTFWYLKRPEVSPLRANVEADVVIIGGGMTGLTAAQAFARKGKKVVLLEAYYCGAGASGKSSGFIEPNAEVSLSEFVDRYGAEGGKTIWDAIQKDGVEHIRSNIMQYKLDCDYAEQDSLDVASSKKDVDGIFKEAENLANLGYETRFIKKEDVPALVNSQNYHAGVMYTNSFGINGYKYCQGMKDVLIRSGVEIYEETPALSIDGHAVTTLHGTVKAEYIVMCVDHFAPSLGKLNKEVYHVQNFLLVSQQLTDQEIQKIFPQKPLMVCDTELVYNFYRMTGNRLLLGGGSLVNLYNATESYNSTYMYKKLTGYIKKTFPDVDIQFEQMWPGLLGVSKDIIPLAGTDKDSKFIYYIAGAAGLPVGAMLGNYCADYLIDNADKLKDYFSPYRTFPVRGALQTILGKKITFALSGFLSHVNIKHV